MTAQKKPLTDLQRKVVKENATEPPFNNEFWQHSKPGIYVDIVSGEPLFSSVDKMESETGWPSFSKPLSETQLVEKFDDSHGLRRVEVRSKQADSHLGHVFRQGLKNDGMGGYYCINSAALRFIPKDELQKEGYGQFLKLF